MKTRTLFSAPLLALLVAGCGGGGDDQAIPNSTGSDNQVRLTVSPEAATSWVQAAIKYSTDITAYTRYFDLFAPVEPASRSLAIKSIGVAPCTYVVRDPNCSGTLRAETEFPVNTPQASFRNGSEMSFQWQNIMGLDRAGGAAINSIDRLSFQTDFPSAPPFTGKFKSRFTQATPSSYETNISFEMTELAVTVDPQTRRAEISGRAKINTTSANLSFADEMVTFSNWSNYQDSQRAGASVRMVSSRYLESALTTLGRFLTVDITVISSDEGRAEYRVIAQTNDNSNSVTRTVLVTFNDQGELVFTAS